MPLSVAHVSFSAAGGAGRVGTLLAREQRRRGIDSRLFSVIDSDLRSEPLKAPLSTSAAVLDEYLIKRASFDASISLMRDRNQGINWKALSGFDVVHLHGINGAVGLKSLADYLANARVVWTLHDMNPFTGACHFALGCEGFTRSCERCPATRAVFWPLVESSLREKSRALQQLKNLSVVAPSRWLASEAERSFVLGHEKVEVVRNPVGEEFFTDVPAEVTRENPDGLRIGVIAQNLSDPRKNVGEAHRAFLMLVERKIPAHLFLVGHEGKEFAGPNVHRLGSLSVEQLIARLDSWDVFINPSRAENSPLTIIEASARGCPAVVARSGGMPEMVSDLGQGSTYCSTTELADALQTMSKVAPAIRTKRRRTLAKRTRELFESSFVVDSYFKLYQK